MTEELKEYVKIETTSDGYALPTVCMRNVEEAVIAYKTVKDALQSKEMGSHRVPNPDVYEMKASNENTKLAKQVTVKGRGMGVVDVYNKATNIPEGSNGV